MDPSSVAIVDSRKRIISWVATRAMPHERYVRTWLRRASLTDDDINDLIQEAYCKMSALDRVDHILHPAAYFLFVARNLLNDRLRRARVVRIEAIHEIEALDVLSDEPTPEDVAASRRELARVLALISDLPPECRRVIEMRKVEGLSQREIALRLGVTEARVEHLGVRGMKLLMQAMRAGPVEEEARGRRKR